MSERIAITLIICGTTVIMGVSGLLTWIGVAHDGTNEGLIVAALVGIPALLLNGALAIVAHYLGSSGAIAAAAQSSKASADQTTANNLGTATAPPAVAAVAGG